MTVLDVEKAPLGAFSFPAVQPAASMSLGVSSTVIQRYASAEQAVDRVRHRVNRLARAGAQLAQNIANGGRLQLLPEIAIDPAQADGELDFFRIPIAVKF